MTIEAMKAIKMVYANTTKHDWPDDIWDAICQAIEAEKHSAQHGEPVAYMYPDDLEKFQTEETFAYAYSVEMGSPTKGNTVPLYDRPYVPTERQLKRYVTTPREWVGLKASEYAAFYNQFAKYQEENPDVSGWWDFADAIEAKLKEKNT